MNEQLQKIVRNDNFKPEDLIEFLQVDVGGRFEVDAGVWEKYTVGEHTFMMMRQFERYFDCDELPSCMDCGTFRFMLVLHDIGKPDAITQGDKDTQHQYTIEIMQKLFGKYGVDETQAKIAYAIVDTDALGDYIRGRSAVVETIEQLIENARHAGIAPVDFFKLLSIFYRCDAGSYTKDAGGFKSLDHLFIFDHSIPSLEFASETGIKVKLLQDELR